MQEKSAVSYEAALLYDTTASCVKKKAFFHRCRRRRLWRLCPIISFSSPPPRKAAGSNPVRRTPKGRCTAIQRPFYFITAQCLLIRFLSLCGTIGHKRQEKTDKIAHGISVPYRFCILGSTRAILSVSWLYRKNDFQMLYAILSATLVQQSESSIKRQWQAKKATRRGCCSGRSALSSLPSICAAPPRQGRCPGSLGK